MKTLLEPQLRALLQENGIRVVPWRQAATAEEAVEAAEELGYPLVMKIVSPDIVHKSEAGGVILGLKDPEEVRLAFQQVEENARAYCPEAELGGVLLSPQLKGQTEVIVGALYDAQFGPAIMVGLGGVFVEVFRDVAFDLAPVSEKQAEAMLRSLKAWPILEGTRGKQGIHIPALCRLISAVSHFVSSYPVAELDLNPVFCDHQQALVGDARLLWRQENTVC